MKNKITLTLLIAIGFLFFPRLNYAQENSNVEYSIFNPTNMPKQYFVSSNSGILTTPLGVKIGYISNPGIYLGFRYGIGEEWDYGKDNKSTNLISIVGGLTKPLIIKNDFSLVAQLGVGYGEWWDLRRTGWTTSGYEIEAGFIIKKKHLLFNLTSNLLNGHNTYATGDICLGIGYVF
jgi:hypothetical protein